MGNHLNLYNAGWIQLVIVQDTTWSKPTTKQRIKRFLDSFPDVAAIHVPAATDAMYAYDMCALVQKVSDK